MSDYQFDLGETQAPRQRGSKFKVGAFALGAVIVGALLVYSGGFDAVLKFLGVGASGIYETTVTNTRQFLGESGDAWLDGEPILDGVSIFGQFSGTPRDPHLDAEQKGFVAAIFSSPTDPSREQYKSHLYTSPIIDLTLDSPHLSAIEVTDFAPADSDITYAYRSAVTPAELETKSFWPFDPSIVNSLQGNVRVAAAIVEQTISQYVQFKIVFDDVDPFARSAVYAVSFQYKESGEKAGFSEDFDGVIRDRFIAIRYLTPNAPASADIDLISADLDNAIVHSVKNVNLSERLSYSFTVGLPSGAYALAVSGKGIQTKIVPFLAGSNDEITVSLGSFELSVGQSFGADLNGDGVVNSLDLQILLNKFTS